MPGKSKKGGGLESSPVYKKQAYGEAVSPFTMRSGNTTPFKTMGSSPVKQEEVSHLIGRQQNVPWDPTIRQEIRPSQIKTVTKKTVKKGLKQTLKTGLKKGLGFLGGKAGLLKGLSFLGTKANVPLAIASMMFGTSSKADQPIDPKTGKHRKTGEQVFKPFKK